MAAAHSTRPLAGYPHHTNTCVDSAVAAVERALDLLGRASSDWRNGGGSRRLEIDRRVDRVAFGVSTGW